MDSALGGWEHSPSVLVLPWWCDPASNPFCPAGVRVANGEDDNLVEGVDGRPILIEGEDDGLGEGVDGGGPTLHSAFGSARLRRFSSSINSP